MGWNFRWAVLSFLGTSFGVRWRYLLAAVLVVPIGLLTRAQPLASYVPAYTGDALWSMELYFVLRTIAPRARLERAALLCFALSVLVELSQLWHPPWLDALRRTTIGHLLLGQGFNAIDLVCYAIGTVIAYALDRAMTRGR